MAILPYFKDLQPIFRSSRFRQASVTSRSRLGRNLGQICHISRSGNQKWRLLDGTPCTSNIDEASPEFTGLGNHTQKDSKNFYTIVGFAYKDGCQIFGKDCNF